MKQPLIVVLSLVAFEAAAQGMAPNKEPVPSPSDLAVERPRIDGDRQTSDIVDPRSASAGGSAAGQPIPENNRGEPIRR